MPPEVFRDDRLLRTVLDSAFAAVRGTPRMLASLLRLIEGQADPNDRRATAGAGIGLCYTPLATRGGRRTGTRERLLQVATRHPDRLRIELDALATRIIFDDDDRAVGVEYLKGARLYRAAREPYGTPQEMREVRAGCEVIIAGGAFNTPQLLMLSGIGEGAALARHGIAVRVDLPGVGRNLQDRYEVGVVNRMARPWLSLDGARFEKGDKPFEAWRDRRSGMYVSNGAALAVTLRSDSQRATADLFCMALLARFAGYKPGYSREVAASHDYLTWTVLKAHTENRAGTVTLNSADPRDPPAVAFRYFEEGSDTAGDDLKAVVEAIRFVRKMTAPLKQDGLIAEEELPGEELDSDDQLAGYVRDTAWGHHASCSCAIGPREAGGCAR